MESRAKILGHSAHQILIVFPLGLLSTAVILDVIYLAANWETASVLSYWMIAAGIIGGLVAAPFGWIDWFAIPQGTRAKAVGLAHAAVNVLALVLFAASWLMRQDGTVAPGTLALIFSFGGLALALVGGWLGGELVARLGVGVYDGANLNAPNSLSGRPTRQDASQTGT